jgi:hypothetical protein
MKILSSRFQVPKKLKTSRFNETLVRRFFENWNLDFLWNLDFEIRDFFFAPCI